MEDRMPAGQGQSSYFVMVHLPFAVGSALFAAFVFYLAGLKFGISPRFSLLLGCLTALSWTVLCTVLVLRTPRIETQVESSLLASGILVVLILVGLSVFAFRLRLSL